MRRVIKTPWWLVSWQPASERRKDGGGAPNHVGAESGVAFRPFPAGTKSGLQLPVCSVAVTCCDVASRNNRNARRCFPNPSLALTIKSLNRFFNTVATRSRSLTSNDYPSLSLSALPHPHPRTRIRAFASLRSPATILISGRLSSPSRVQLFSRRARACTIYSPSSLLSNPGFDARVGFFAAVKQHLQQPPEYSHMCCPFTHNDMFALNTALQARDAPGRVRYGQEERSGVFVDAESVHHMNGKVAPFRVIFGTMNEVAPYGQRTLFVAGAHN